MQKKILKDLIINHIITYPTPANFSYFFNFGSLAGLCLFIQILTGIFLAMYYSSSSLLAFDSVEYIMRQVPNGWFVRYAHSNGASIFFMVIYIHIARGFYYGSYKYDNKEPWLSGFIIYILMMATAFLGYVLPWGQMSFWGATVITNFFSAIPFIGKDLVLWLWGGFAVGAATLSRFFSIHYLLPFLIAGIVVIHLAYLHEVGSSNPFYLEHREINQFYIFFYPYFFIKDFLGILILFLVFSIFLFYSPNFLGHSDNYIEANPLVTPEHIVPEWYFLPFYAILRSIPDKLGGILVMALALIIPLLLPLILGFFEKFLGFSYFFGRFNLILLECLVFFFFSFFLLLGWLGAQPIEDPYPMLGIILSLAYFFCLLLFILIPFIQYFNFKSLINVFIVTRGNSIIEKIIENIKNWVTWIDIPFFIFYLITILLFIAFFTYMERRFIAQTQRRMGPNRVGPMGLSQPFADMLKLVQKETVLPRRINRFLFFLGPSLTLGMALLLWFFVPFSSKGAYFNGSNSIFIIIAVSTLEVYGILIAGWATYSNWPIFGALRGVCQMLCYEMVVSLLFLPAISMAESVNFYDIVISQQRDIWYIFYFCFVPLLYLLTVLAETNRTPFDLAEAEGEIVGGFHTEFSSFAFSFFFLAEYSNMGALLSLMIVLYFGGWTFIDDTWILNTTHLIEEFINTYIVSKIFYQNRVAFEFSVYFTETLVSIIKLLVLICLLIIFRAAFPRINLVNLPRFFWKYLIPFSICYLWYLVTFFLNINPAFILFQKKTLIEANKIFQFEEFDWNKDYDDYDPEELRKLFNRYYEYGNYTQLRDFKSLLKKEKLSQEDVDFLLEYFEEYNSSSKKK